MTEPVIEGAAAYPTPESVLAELRLYARQPDEWTEGTIEERARRLSALRQLKALTDDIILAVEQSLIESMEADDVPVAGVGMLRRGEVTRSTWRYDGASEQMRDDLARAVATHIATDIATGEIDQLKRNIALHTMRAAYSAIPQFSSLKQAARRTFGLTLGDYRQYDTVYKVTIEEAV